MASESASAACTEAMSVAGCWRAACEIDTPPPPPPSRLLPSREGERLPEMLVAAACRVPCEKRYAAPVGVENLGGSGAAARASGRAAAPPESGDCSGLTPARPPRPLRPEAGPANTVPPRPLPPVDTGPRGNTTGAATPLRERTAPPLAGSALPTSAYAAAVCTAAPAARAETGRRSPPADAVRAGPPRLAGDLPRARADAPRDSGAAAAALPGLASAGLARPLPRPVRDAPRLEGKPPPVDTFVGLRVEPLRCATGESRLVHIASTSRDMLPLPRTSATAAAPAASGEGVGCRSMRGAASRVLGRATGC